MPNLRKAEKRKRNSTTLKILTTYIASLLLLLVISCKQKTEKTTCFYYPKQIDSLQIGDLYDTARLYIFTWLCDRKIDGYYRGQFELKYMDFFMRNDTIELFFSHSLPKERQDTTAFSDYTHRTSIAFNIKSKQKLWGWDINGFSDALEPSDERFKNPATNEVVNFIRENKTILDPCFTELAKKTHLLEE